MSKKKVAYVAHDHLEGWRGHATLYRLEPAFTWTDWADGKRKQTTWIVVSAVDAFGLFGGEETYVFAADFNGKVKSMSELPGSLKGTLSHRKVLKEMGYEIDQESALSGRLPKEMRNRLYVKRGEKSDND
jgi:hypothetical protein